MEEFEKLDWEAMKQVDPATVDPETLVDIGTVHLDAVLSREQRVREFIRQIKNPYCFRCGQMVVKLCFAQEGDTLEERMRALEAFL